MSEPLRKTSLSVRAVGCLASEGVHTTDDLIKYLDTHGVVALLRIPNMRANDAGEVLALSQNAKKDSTMPSTMPSIGVLTVRDHFAVHALQELIRNPTRELFSFAARAEWAYQQADAMMKERAK